MVGLFPGGHPMAEQHQATLAWHDEFGPTLQPADVAVIDSRVAAMVQEADAIIAASPTLVANGITNWKAYAEREEISPETRKLVDDLLFQPGGLGWRIEGTESELEGYQPLALDDLTPAQLARAQEVNRTEEWRSLQSAELLQFLLDYPAGLAGLVLLVSVLIAAPLVTADRVSRMRPVQACTSTGRRLLAVQLIATAVVTLGVTILLVIGTSLPLAGFGFATFWDTPIQSFTAGSLYPAITLGQYCWLLVACVLLVGMLGGLVGFALSRANRAYPALAISVMVGLAAGLPLAFRLLDLPLTYFSPLAYALGTPFGPPIALATLVVVALAVCLIQLRHERHLDIND